MADPISDVDYLKDNLQEDEDVDSHSSRCEEQDALRCFIEQYELSPELWNPTNPKYSKKNARNSALDRLIPFLVKLKPEANKREDVKKKINTLRTNYRKEIKKIAASKRSGKSPDELYTPSSWVFFSLSFLERFEKPVQQQPTITRVSHEFEEEEELDTATSSVAPRPFPQPARDETTTTASTSSMDPPPFPQSRTAKKLKTQGPLSKQNMLLQKACSLLEVTQNPENSLPAISKAWGEKLLTLDNKQRIYAEKAINDILFEASLGNLNRNSVSINVNEGTSISGSASNSSFSTITYCTSPTYEPPHQTEEISNMDNSSIITLFSNFEG